MKFSVHIETHKFTYSEQGSGTHTSTLKFDHLYLITGYANPKPGSPPWDSQERLALPCISLPCLVLSCLALPCLVLSCLALPCLLPCLALTCIALRDLPCLALSGIALPCLGPLN